MSVEVIIIDSSGSEPQSAYSSPYIQNRIRKITDMIEEAVDMMKKGLDTSDASDSVAKFIDAVNQIESETNELADLRDSQ